MGKGSGRRPTLVGEEKFADNWARTFGGDGKRDVSFSDPSEELRGMEAPFMAYADDREDTPLNVQHYGGTAYLLNDGESLSDPAVFVERVLGVKVEPWQAEVLRKMVAPHDYREYLRRFLVVAENHVQRKPFIFAGKYAHAARFARELGLNDREFRYIGRVSDVYGLRGVTVFQLETARQHPLYFEIRQRLHYTGAHIVEANLDRLVGVERPERPVYLRPEFGVGYGRAIESAIAEEADSPKPPAA